MALWQKCHLTCAVYSYQWLPGHLLPSLQADISRASEHGGVLLENTMPYIFQLGYAQAFDSFHADNSSIHLPFLCGLLLPTCLLMTDAIIRHVAPAMATVGLIWGTSYPGPWSSGPIMYSQHMTSASAETGTPSAGDIWTLADYSDGNIVGCSSVHSRQHDYTSSTVLD